MPDRGVHHDDEYGSVEEYELIESLKDDDKGGAHSGGSKFLVIIGGLLLGAAAVFFLSEDATEKPAAKPAPSARAPEKRKIIIPETPAAKITPEPVKEAPPKPPPDPPVPVKKNVTETVDDKIAKLMELNQIDKDLKAPGSVTDDEAQDQQPETTAKTVAPEPAPAPLKKVVSTTAKPDRTKSAIQDADTGTYTVIVFATADVAKAQDRRDKLMALGYRSWIARKGKVKQTTYTVETGRFNSVRQAARQSQSLANAGFHSRVTYLNSRHDVTLTLGSFRTLIAAEKLASRADKAGFDVRLEKRSDPQDLYVVRVGRYKTIVEAQGAERKLRKNKIQTRGIGTF